MNDSKNSQTENHDALEKQINQALDSSVENLSPDVRRSLNQMRLSATERKKKLKRLVPLTTSLAVTFAVILGWQLTDKPLIEESPFAEVLQEDLEMLDDLEFIFWMNEAADSAQL